MREIQNLIIYCSKTWWAFLLLIVLFSLSLFSLIQISAQFAQVTNNFQPFDMQEKLSATEIESQLTSYTSESHKFYFRFFIADFFFPLLGGFFIATLASFSLRNLNLNQFHKLETSLGFMLFLSPTVFDWLENVSTIFLLQAYPPINSTFISIILFFKSAKFFTLFSFQGLAFLLLFLAIIKFVFKFFTEKKNQ